MPRAKINLNLCGLRRRSMAFPLQISLYLFLCSQFVGLPKYSTDDEQT